MAKNAENLAAIEGLDYLDRLAGQWARYRVEYNRYIAGDGLGKAPVKPDETLEEGNAQYPRAAAYRKARSWERSNNSDKYSAGKRAKKRILSGEDHNQVIADMEAEWSAAILESSRSGWDIVVSQ